MIKQILINQKLNKIFLGKETNSKPALMNSKLIESLQIILNQKNKISDHQWSWS